MRSRSILRAGGGRLVGAPESSLHGGMVCGYPAFDRGSTPIPDRRFTAILRADDLRHAADSPPSGGSAPASARPRVAPVDDRLARWFRPRGREWDRSRGGVRRPRGRAHGEPDLRCDSRRAPDRVLLGARPALADPTCFPATCRRACSTPRRTSAASRCGGRRPRSSAGTWRPSSLCTSGSPPSLLPTRFARGSRSTWSSSGSTATGPPFRSKPHVRAAPTRMAPPQLQAIVGPWNKASVYWNSRMGAGRRVQAARVPSGSTITAWSHLFGRTSAAIPTSSSS